MGKYKKELLESLLIKRIENILEFDIPYYEQCVLIKQRIENYKKSLFREKADKKESEK